MGGSGSLTAVPETLCAGRSKVEGWEWLAGSTDGAPDAPEMAGACVIAVEPHGTYTARACLSGVARQSALPVGGYECGVTGVISNLLISKIN
jgi:hypothetical protein